MFLVVLSSAAVVVVVVVAVVSTVVASSVVTVLDVVSTAGLQADCPEAVDIVVCPLPASSTPADHFTCAYYNNNNQWLSLWLSVMFLGYSAS